MSQNLNFLIKHTYSQRKSRREMGKGKSAKKHLDTKVKQIKYGEQARVVARMKYSLKAMARLPEDVRKAIKIRVLQDTGVMRLDEDRKERIVKHYENIRENKRKRNKLATLDMNKVRNQAKTMASEHDMNWHSREYTKELQLYEEFLKKVYWSKITGQLKTKQDKSNLHKEIRLVLPHFHCEDVAKATASALKSAKSDDNVNLGKYLKKIEAIVALKEKNTITGDDKLEDMTELERYKLFIKADVSPRITSVKKQLENKRKRMKSVLGLFGTTPRYGMSSTEEEENEGDAFTAYLDA